LRRLINVSDTIIQIICKENGDIAVNGNCRDLARIVFIIEKLKLSILTAKPKEPSLIQPVANA